MVKFILKRLLYGIITMFVIITLTFFLIHKVPGDPMSSGAKNLPEASKMAFKEKYGLNKSVPEQYLMYLKSLAKGDLGTSMVNPGRDVNSIITRYAPNSAKIGIIALVIQVGIGVLLGIIAAFCRDRWPDKVIMLLVVVLVCLPSFVYVALLQYLFAIKLKLVPVMGWGKPKHFVLPVLALAIAGIASYCKFTRNSTLNVVSQDYIITAKSKGLSQSRIVRKHILRNSMIPIVTLLGPAILDIFNGAFIVESVFGIPGMGQYYIKAVTESDFSIIMGLTIFASALYVISLIIVDIVYGIVDPRIRIAKGR